MVRFALDIKCGTQWYLDLFKLIILYCTSLHYIVLHYIVAIAIVLYCVVYILSKLEPCLECQLATCINLECHLSVDLIFISRTNFLENVYCVAYETSSY